MVLLEEAVERAITRAGITLVPLSVFRYNEDRLNVIFRDAVREFGQFKPRHEVYHGFIPETGLTLPEETQTVSGVSVGFTADVGSTRAFSSSRIYSTEWYYDKATRLLNIPSAGYYRVSYLANPKVCYQAVTLRDICVQAGRTSFNMTLPAANQESSLRMSFLVNGVEERFSTEIGGVLQGTLGNGQIVQAATRESTAWSLDFDFAPPPATDGVIQITYTSRNLGCEHIREQDTEFFDLFASDLLRGFAHSKLMLRFDGLPLDLDMNLVLTMANELRAKAQQDLNERSHWEAWMGKR